MSSSLSFSTSCSISSLSSELSGMKSVSFPLSPSRLCLGLVLEPVVLHSPGKSFLVTFCSLRPASEKLTYLFWRIIKLTLYLSPFCQILLKTSFRNTNLFWRSIRLPFVLFTLCGFNIFKY